MLGSIIMLRPYIANPSLLWNGFRVCEPHWCGKNACVSTSREANLYIRPTHLGCLAGKFSLRGRGALCFVKRRPFESDWWTSGPRMVVLCTQQETPKRCQVTWAYWQPCSRIGMLQFVSDPTYCIEILPYPKSKLISDRWACAPIGQQEMHSFATVGRCVGPQQSSEQILSDCGCAC